MNGDLHTTGAVRTLEEILVPIHQIIDVFGNAHSTMSTTEKELVWPHVIEIISYAENGSRSLLTSAVLVLLENQEWNFTTKVMLAKFINNVQQIVDSVATNCQVKALVLCRSMASLYAFATAAAVDESASILAHFDTTTIDEANKAEKTTARGIPADSDCDSGNKSDDESGQSDSTIDNQSEDRTTTIEGTNKPEKVRVITRGGPADSDSDSANKSDDESDQSDFDNHSSAGATSSIEETNEKVLTCGSLADVDSDSVSESDNESDSSWCDIDDEQHNAASACDEALDSLTDWANDSVSEFTPSESETDSADHTPESDSDEYYFF